MIISLLLLIVPLQPPSSLVLKLVTGNLDLYRYPMVLVHLIGYCPVASNADVNVHEVY